MKLSKQTRMRRIFLKAYESKSAKRREWAWVFAKRNNVIVPAYITYCPDWD